MRPVRFYTHENKFISKDPGAGFEDKQIEFITITRS